MTPNRAEVEGAGLRFPWFSENGDFLQSQPPAHPEAARGSHVGLKGEGWGHQRKGPCFPHPQRLKVKADHRGPGRVVTLPGEFVDDPDCREGGQGLSPEGQGYFRLRFVEGTQTPCQGARCLSFHLISPTISLCKASRGPKGKVSQDKLNTGARI